MYLLCGCENIYISHCNTIDYGFCDRATALAALSISFFGKNHFGKRNNGIMLKLFLYLILCLWVVSVKTGNIVVLIYDKLFKRALHKFKLWMVYLWKLKPVLSPHLWRWQHAASDKVQSVRMSENHRKNAPNHIFEMNFPKVTEGWSIYWVEAEVSGILIVISEAGQKQRQEMWKRIFWGQIWWKHCTRVTLTLSIPISYIMHSVLNG